MTSSDHILPDLYKNGWSGVVDVSKHFHMFLAKEDEHKFLDLVNPRKNKIYAYNTLSMGTKNSPSASWTAFLRHIIDKFPCFKGLQLIRASAIAW